MSASHAHDSRFGKQGIYFRGLALRETLVQYFARSLTGGASDLSPLIATPTVRHPEARRFLQPSEGSRVD